MKARVKLFILMAALCGVSGCRTEEGLQLQGAVESFVDYSFSNEERPNLSLKGPTETRGSRERSRELDTRGSKAILSVDVDLPHTFSADQVETDLFGELNRLAGEGDYDRIKVRALPAGLLTYGRVLGTGDYAKGRPEKTRQKVRVTVRDDAPPLSDEQYRALVDLELAAAGLRGAAAARARREVEKVRGRKLVTGAIAAARKRFGGGKI